MPTYQYACTECGHAFEQFQGFSDDALSVCPVCAGRLRKVYNAVGVVFKGSGFYRNDSRTDGRDGKKSESASGADRDKGGSETSSGTTTTESTGGDKGGAKGSGTGGDTSGSSGGSTGGDKAPASSPSAGASSSGSGGSGGSTGAA